jgi:hypothetical protein
MKMSGMLCKKPFNFGYASGICNLPLEHAKGCGLVFGVMRVELTDGSFADWMAREPDAVRVGCRMGDATFRAFLNLMMRADDIQDEKSYTPLGCFADNESRARGYDGWIVAYHEFKGAK